MLYEYQLNKLDYVFFKSVVSANICVLETPFRLIHYQYLDTKFRDYYACLFIPVLMVILIHGHNFLTVNVDCISPSAKTCPIST